MAHLELAFASKDTSLSVRTFSIREGISKPFDVSVIARSEVHDLDLDAFLGKGGALAVGSDLPSAALKGARVWHGVVSHMEQLAVEPDGLSTYFLRIVPDLHRTTLRKNARVFQNKTIPEIVRALLAEWQIDPELRLGADYPRFEYRVQYDETDFAFLNRLLEEAGIAYFFRHGEVGHGESPSSKEKSRLVLCDAPGHAEPRAGGPLPFVDEPTHAGRREHVRHVRLRHQMKPGRVTVRDFDFRTRPDYQLLAEAREAAADEERYEHFHYAPGAFVVLGDKGGETPVADDRGAARVDERRAAALAERMLHAHRGDRRRVTFASNCVDLHPGTVMSVADHPRADLADPLLVTDMTLEGSHAGEWSVQCEAAFGKSPWRPQPKTPRPRVHGVQSAVVVGPPGEEIHTDEFGRVRVQFHWDRQGKFDEQSSCWIRVSHGWAGSSYGMLSIPRVGQEVLVEFYEGDPDRPVITGRVYNNTTRVPYKLPEDKTKSGWKTSSSPGADGFSELMFDDRKGKELVFLQAQKDLSTIVKDSESHVVGNDRATNVGANDALTIGKNLRVDVAADHALTVGGDAGVEVLGSRDTTVAVSETVRVGASYALSLGADTGVVMQDGRLTITNGKASIVISGGDIFFDASGDVTISAGGKLTLSGQEVSADASPLVLLNCGAPLAPSVVKLAAETLAHAVKDVEKEANHLAKAIEMAGHGKWVFPGELVDAVEDAPEFLELDGGIFGDIKKGVKELEHEAALLKKKLHPYLHYLKLAEHLIHHHSLKDIEHEVLHLLGLDQLDGLLGGMNKHKLYGGGGGHGPHPHHPHPGGGNGNHPHQPHPGGGGGNGNHPHQPHAGGGGNGNHPHQPHAGGGGNGNHPHQPHPGGGGGGGNGNHP
ncbi:MAG TPA: type VI secretion system tip protein TssI/VgrG, partial [Minicystis sp.]|nr:type VI secretion system tip protein TssI/VgrG [Minicystis sp.]